MQHAGDTSKAVPEFTLPSCIPVTAGNNSKVSRAADGAKKDVDSARAIKSEDGGQDDVENDLDLQSIQELFTSIDNAQKSTEVSGESSTVTAAACTDSEVGDKVLKEDSTADTPSKAEVEKDEAGETEEGNEIELFVDKPRFQNRQKKKQKGRQKTRSKR